MKTSKLLKNENEEINFIYLTHSSTNFPIK